MNEPAAIFAEGFDAPWRLGLLAHFLEAVDDVALLVWRVEDYADAGAMRLVLWTPGTAAATGVPAAQCLGQTLREAFPPLLDTPVPESYLQVARSGAPLDLGEVDYGDARVRRALYHVRAFPLPDDCVGVHLKNVTHLHEAESERRAAEQRYRDLFENASDLIQSVAPDGRLQYANRAWCDTFGYAPEEVGTVNIFELIHPDSQAHCQELFGRLMQGERVGRVEADFVTRAGDRITLAGDVSVRFEGERPVETRAIFRNVTEQRAVDRMKDEFVSTVSHELRTPLTSIRGSLGLLEAGVAGALPDKANELIGIATKNSDRLIRLINDILDLEKLATGRLELRREPLDCGELLQTVARELGGMAATIGVHVVVTPVPELPGRLIGDRDRLLQVLTNLGANAIKYTPPGGTVTLDAGVTDDRTLRIAVSDQGPGVPAEHHELIFERFRQVDGSDTRAKGGSGLGLAIARQIAQQHDGEIRVGDAPGGGACFSVHLPLVPAAPPATPGQAPLLVVEDDDSLRAMLCRMLNSAGLPTQEAATLADARAVLKAHVPLAVLLDVRLPDGDGLQLLESLRGEARTAAVPVIVISGSVERPGGVEGLVLLDWIRKPFAMDSVMSAVRRALGDSQRARVLIVEDDAGVRQVVRESLDVIGVEVLEAADGASALAMARGQAPDLIILDVGLPLVDGFEFVDLLRGGRGEDTPLIVYSGRDLDRAERSRLQLGVTRHLTKSRVGLEELLTTVQSVLALTRKVETPGG